LGTWLADAQRATWRSPNEIRTTYANASIIGNEWVVFNIRGNNYRLIVAISYRAQIVLIKFIGTHADYDKVDAEMVSH
jgi:mRNA interferase HigB